MRHWTITNNRLDFSKHKITKLIPDTMKLNWLNSKNTLIIIGLSFSDLKGLTFFLLSCTSHFKEVQVVCENGDVLDSIDGSLASCECSDILLRHTVPFDAKPVNGEVTYYDVTEPKFYVVGDTYTSEPFETSQEAMRFCQTKYKLSDGEEYDVISKPVVVKGEGIFEVW